VNSQQGAVVPAEAVTPTFIAALAANIIIGLYTLVTTGLNITGDEMVDVIVYITMLLNILYFYSFEAYTEFSPQEQERMKRLPRLEFHLRTLNQIVLTVMTLLLSGSIFLFGAAFIFFYIMLLIWDWVVVSGTRRLGTSEPLPVILYDLVGLGTTCLFLIMLTIIKIHKGLPLNVLPSFMQHAITASLNIVTKELSSMILGMCMIVYLGIIAFWMRSVHFYPWRYLRR
jgi:hypothetical protein